MKTTKNQSRPVWVVRWTDKKGLKRAVVYDRFETAEASVKMRIAEGGKDIQLCEATI